MSRPELSRAAQLYAAACSGMFVFGIVMALLGAILPSMAERLRFEVVDVGTLFLVMNAAMLACCLALGLAIDRFGMKPPLAVGPLLVAAALAAIARASVFADLLPAVVLLGIGGGALNGATNTLAADLYEDPKRKNAALNLLGVFFGFGALFLPLAIGSLLAVFSVAQLVWMAAFLAAVSGLFAMTLRFPVPKQAHALPVGDIPRFLRSPLVLALAALLFFQSGVEFTMGGFTSLYLMRGLGVASVASASWILAGYWAAIIVARVILSRVALGTDPYRILLVSALGSCAGTTLMAAAPSPPVATVGVAMTGAMLAGIFPTALAIAGARFKTHSGTVIGILLTMALSGGMTLPWMAGQIGEAAGLRWVFGMVAAAFAMILVLSRVAARVAPIVE